MQTSFIRSPLARTLYQRALEDNYEHNRDHSYWYKITEDRLPDRMCPKFLQSHEDAETQQFLENCYAKSDWVITQVFQLLMKSMLSWVMTNTSINGLLGRGSMFVYSSLQFQNMLGVNDTWRADKLLDLGAGDGMVTQKMAPHFNKVFTTELSGPMVWRLNSLGYSVLGLEEWDNGTHQYDIISCLNLLDRCSKPASLLRSIRNSLVPGTGRAIVATVIPFKPYVESGWGSHRPEQYLHVKGRTFEEQVSALIDNVFTSAGFTVERFTRLPYLCEGDLEHSFYVLDDAVFVLKPL